MKKLLYNNPNLPNVNPDKLLKITVIMNKVPCPLNIASSFENSCNPVSFCHYCSVAQSEREPKKESGDDAREECRGRQNEVGNKEFNKCTWK